jgi:hypothetical protein
MKSTTLLRIAAVLTLIHAVLHTVGGLLSAPDHGAEEINVLNTMKSFQFDFMGSMRSYWDFYLGFGLIVTLFLLVETVLLWQVASLAKSDPGKARPFMLTLLAAFIATMILSWRYFFIAPLVVEGVIALLIGLAYVLSRRNASA